VIQKRPMSAKRDTKFCKSFDRDAILGHEMTKKFLRHEVTKTNHFF